MARTLPIGAAKAIDRYLDAVDAAVPGLVVGLHVCGSLALGDYEPERSDIDVVAVVAAELTPAPRNLISEVHRVVATRVDGPYLTVAEMASDPERIGAVPFHVDGKFEVGMCHEVSPVTWAILANDAITVRGDEPKALGVVENLDAVREFSAENLRNYWAGWARTISSLIADTSDDDTMEARMVEWAVLGVARVHLAATTGRVVSKLDAADYARNVLNGPGDLVNLAVASRTGAVDQFRVGDLRRACDFVASVSSL